MGNKQVIAVGGARSAEQEKAPRIVNVGGQDYDVGAVLDPLDALGAALMTIKKNPFNPAALSSAQNASKALRAIQLPPALRSSWGPVVKQAGALATAARTAIGLRVRMSAELSKQPTQALPVNLVIANTVTSSPFIISSPYLGSGGGTQNGIWTVTDIDTGALTGLRGMLFTSLIFAGHDYVSAATTAATINYGAGVGKASVLGWPFEMFAADKYPVNSKRFRPWNVMGVAPIMRETGTIGMTVYNGTGSTFTGTVTFYVQASLCGSPFKSEDIVRTFVQPSKKLKSALALQLFSGSKFRNAFGQSASGLDDLEGMLDFD